MNNKVNMQDLIDAAVALQEKIALATSNLEAVKAKIQEQLYARMRDRNLSYCYADGAKGRAELMVRTKLDIVDWDAVKKLLGSQAEENIEVVTEPKYKIRTKYKIALTALLKLDYEQSDLETVLKSLGANSDAVKVLLKKLKGEYKKDIRILTAAGLGSGELEEELDVIRSVKNYELIKSLFDMDNLDCCALARAISVEDTLALAITASEN